MREVGDKVKFVAIEAEYLNYRNYIGQVGHITEVIEDVPYPYRVWLESDFEVLLSEEEVETA